MTAGKMEEGKVARDSTLSLSPQLHHSASDRCASKYHEHLWMHPKLTGYTLSGRASALRLFRGSRMDIGLRTIAAAEVR